MKGRWWCALRRNDGPGQAVREAGSACREAGPLAVSRGGGTVLRIGGGASLVGYALLLDWCHSRAWGGKSLGRGVDPGRQDP